MENFTFYLLLSIKIILMKNLLGSFFRSNLAWNDVCKNVYIMKLIGELKIRVEELRNVAQSKNCNIFAFPK